jgi:hypothetical protein
VVINVQVMFFWVVTPCSYVLPHHYTASQHRRPQLECKKEKKRNKVKICTGGCRKLHYVELCNYLLCLQSYGRVVITQSV